MAKRKTRQAINEEVMASFVESFSDAPPSAAAKLDLKWKPKLNPTQERVYLSKAIYILAYGERATGKSIGALHKVVRHCVHNKNAFALIIVKESGQAVDGGAWHKLQTEILPQWKNGNYDRVTKRNIDNGCGIDYTPPKLDNTTKKPYIWISNKFGGYSQVMLISLFVGEHVDGKIKGKEPSIVFIDEAQTTDTDDYFSKITMQLGRRNDADEPQQIIFCANPKGPSHWLYKQFLDDPIDEDTGHKYNPDTGQLDERYGVFHVPIHENKHNLQPGYWERVEEACRTDEVEAARMLRGEWVDKPEGDSLFVNQWVPAFHIRGDAIKNKGIVPFKGHPIIVGYDLGSAHTSIHFLQNIPTLNKKLWLCFDELNYVDRYMPYRKLVRIEIDRLMYWEKMCGDYVFSYRHISDNSAFNQFRPGGESGSFDVQDIEKFSREYVEEKKLPERFIIKLEECPKGRYSVAARVRITKENLTDNALLVSATCQKTTEMFMRLEEDPKERENPKRSKHIHVFDSLTYPQLFFSARKSIPQVTTDRIKPEFYVIGK